MLHAFIVTDKPVVLSIKDYSIAMVKSLPSKALWGSFIREILVKLSVIKLIKKLYKIF